MVRIPGTTFSDHVTKIDWEKKYHDLKEHVNRLKRVKSKAKSCIREAALDCGQEHTKYVVPGYLWNELKNAIERSDN